MSALEQLRQGENAPSEQTYVFEQTEVQKTGRTASNKLRSGKTEILFEITPVDKMTGSWRKWVRDDILFTVQK